MSCRRLISQLLGNVVVMQLQVNVDDASHFFKQLKALTFCIFQVKEMGWEVRNNQRMNYYRKYTKENVNIVVSVECQIS
jgi:hypothetical protein